MTKFCLPIIKISLQEVLKTIEKYPDYDLYEVWVDYLTDSFPVILACPESLSLLLLSKRDPGRARSSLARMTIICFRRKHGEVIQIPFELRKEIINNSIGKTILIDCDIEQQKEDLKYINSLPDGKKKIIASYHNYKKTPNEKELNKIINLMEKYNPEIYKIATYCQNPDDAVRLMQLLLKLKKQNKKAIILGMGEYGKITRLFGVLYGNEITFTSETKEEQSAEGQMTRDEIKNILSMLSF